MGGLTPIRALPRGDRAPQPSCGVGISEFAAHFRYVLNGRKEVFGWKQKPSRQGSGEPSESEGLTDLAAALEYAAEIDSDEVVREYVARFSELEATGDLAVMREFVGKFVDKIELCRPTKDRRKPRRVLLHGKMPGLTRLEVASPTGLEPVLPP